jgi:hypothetical protein
LDLSTRCFESAVVRMALVQLGLCSLAAHR